MERLNIPLGTNPLTTRRPRRVLSFILLFLVLLFCVSRLSTLWLTRNTTAREMPDGTLLAIRLTPTRGEWQKLEQRLNHFPLISNRGLRFSDLRPFTAGELTLFFGSDGTRSVAIRSKAARLPQELLDAHGIVVQPVSSHTFLLSERLLPLSPAPFSRFEFSELLPRPHRIGTVYLQNDRWLKGHVTFSNESVTATIPRLRLGRLPWKSLPEETFAALALPTLGSFPLQILSASTELVLEQWKIPLPQYFLSSPDGSRGSLLLSRHEGQDEYLLTGSADQLSEEDQRSFLRAITALGSPALRPWVLPDATRAAELVADPALVTLESSVTAGVEVWRAKTGSGEPVLTARTQDRFGFSNSEALFNFWLNKEKKSEHSSCFGNHLWLDLAQANSSVASESLEPSFVDVLGQNFAKISINSSILFTKIRFCF